MKSVTTMPTTLIKKCVRAYELPLAWQKEINAQPKQLFNIQINTIDDIDYDVDGTPMPPESQISDKIIKAVQVSEKDIKQGNFVICNSKEERKALFDKIWDSNE